MDFDELKVAIAKRANIDIDPIFARYRALAPSPSVDSFLMYLRDQRVIDTRLFTELHTSENVDATDIDPKSFALGATVQSQNAGDAMATKITSPTTESGAVEPPLPANNAAVDPNHTEQYELLGALGKGAMGEVHLARDIFLRRKVALKTILPQMQQNEALFSRFLGEMQITAQLDHPFIVPVYGLENMPTGGVGYAMKLVQGREFADLLKETRTLLEAKKPLDGEHSLEGRLETFLKVCDAVAYANERGVVHRDLKPANIMIGRFNEVYVMDWGIARLMGKAHPGQDKGVEMYDAAGSDVRETTRTRIGSTIGTPIYMSPEQAAGRNDELDGRSDLYSLGLILQEIVTLQGAVGGTTLEEVLTNAKTAQRLPPRPPAPGIVVPRELRAIIDKATRLRPEDRYPNVTAFADDVRRYLRNEAVTAQPDTGAQGAGRWVSKHRMATIVMLLLAMVAGAGATIGVLLYNGAVVKQQHTRELRLAELQATSAMRAQDLDVDLQRFQSQLTRLAGALGLALTGSRGQDSTLHFADDFKAGPNAVSGLVDAPAYGGLVSFDWPVASLAKGVTKESLGPELGAASDLRTLAKSVMLESVDPAYHSMSAAERQRALTSSGVPITRVALTTESGLHVEYPGNARLAPDFDARETATYKEASKKYGVVWGAPIAGKEGQIVLPCSAALRDGEGKLVGVLSFEIDPSRSVGASVDADGGDYVETSLLVDTQGKVLAQKNHADTAPEGDTLALTDVKEAMGRGERGYLQTERAGHPVVVSYQPLTTVGWYVVTIANVDRMKHSETREGVRGGSVLPTVRTAKPIASPPPPTAPVATATPTAEPTAEPSASASAAPPDAAASAPLAAPLKGKLSDLQRSAAPVVSAAAPPPPPPNPFEPWKAYDKDNKK